MPGSAVLPPPRGGCRGAVRFYGGAGAPRGAAAPRPAPGSTAEPQPAGAHVGRAHAGGSLPLHRPRRQHHPRLRAGVPQGCGCVPGQRATCAGPGHGAWAPHRVHRGGARRRRRPVLLTAPPWDRPLSVVHLSCTLTGDGPQPCKMTTGTAIPAAPVEPPWWSRCHRMMPSFQSPGLDRTQMLLPPPNAPFSA